MTRARELVPIAGNARGPVLTESDSGQTVELPVNGVFTVRLRENPTTGYRWLVESSSGMTLVAGDFQPGAGAVGGSGTRVLSFRTTSAGTHHLRLSQRREWQRADAAIGQFAATIIVR